MQIFSIDISRGKLYSKLSITSIMSPHTLISDTNAGNVNMNSKVIKLYSSRIFDCTTSRASWLSGGHNPMIFNMSRFRLIVHSKSVIKKNVPQFPFIPQIISLRILFARKNEVIWTEKFRMQKTQTY